MLVLAGSWVNNNNTFYFFFIKLFLSFFSKIKNILI